MPKRSRIPKPKFYLNNPKSKTQTGIVMVYYYGQVQRLKYAVGEEINPKYWDQKKQKILIQTKRHEELEVYLERIKNAAIEIFKKFDYGKIPVDKFRFELDVMLGFRERIVKKPVGFFELMEQMIEVRKESPELDVRGTWKVIETWYNILTEYSNTMPYQFSYEDINEDWFEKFKVFCFKKKGHSINYVHKGSTIIKQVMNEGLRKEYHSNLRYQTLTVKKVPTNKTVLYLDEIEKLYQAKPTNETDIRVWINIFVGCFTGMRFSDWQKVKKELIQEINGMKLINVFTDKTSVQVAIPLLDVLERVLEDCNYEVPPIVSQVFNRRMKVLVKEAGIDRKIHFSSSKGGKLIYKVAPIYEKISSHACRRSFASNFTLIGCPPSMLMPITGHKSEKQFREYVNIEGRQNAEAFAKYANMMKFNFDK